MIPEYKNFLQSLGWSVIMTITLVLTIVILPTDGTKALAVSLTGLLTTASYVLTIITFSPAYYRWNHIRRHQKAQRR